MVSNKLEKESLFVGTKDGRPWSSFMFPNGHNIKWNQLQSKYGICPRLGALDKYFQFISMIKSIANWNYLFARIEKDLSGNPHKIPAKVILIQRIGFSKKKKKIIMNKSSSLLLHLHLLHFLIMNKSSYFKKKKNQFFLNLSKKKKEGNFQKGPLD